MKKHFIEVAGFVLCLSGSFVSHAQDSTLLLTPYGGMGVGLSQLDPQLKNTGYSIEDGERIGFKFFGGADINRHFSAELYYVDQDKAKLNPGGSISYRDYGLSGLFYFYRHGAYRKDISAFVRAGVGKMSNNSGTVPYERVHEQHVMLGAGLEYELDHGFAIRLETELYDEDSRFISFNLMKRFDTPKPLIKRPLQIPQPELVSYEEPEPVVLDRDQDGVMDEADQCPDTAAGEKVDEHGCTLVVDSDGDGVEDRMDQCPATPTGVVVDETGCKPPPQDSDADGVLDDVDQCPDSPAGQKVDETGCELKQVIVLEGVVFGNNSDELAGGSKEKLNAVRDTLNRYPDMRIEISGHSDTRGSWTYNQKLSQKRAESVRRYLIEQGIAAERLLAKGFGPDKPIADNDTAEGRAANRRVEMRVLKEGE